MAEDVLGPDDLTASRLPTARRGYDRKAVDDLLTETALRWSKMREHHERLLEEVDARGGADNLGRDLREIGEQVSRLLGDAQETAESLRVRAAEEIRERLAAADSQAADVRAVAEGEAFRLRGDAWDAGAELLAQVKAGAAAMIEQAEAEVLIIRAAAEQDAHRRVADARREASEITRTARFEGERTVGEARRLADRLAADARREAGETEATVEPPVAGADWAVKVVGPDEEEPARQPSRGADPHHPDYGDALANEVASLWESEVAPAVTVEPEAEPPMADAGPVPEEAEPEPETEAETGTGEEEPSQPDESPAEMPGPVDSPENPAVEVSEVDQAPESLSEDVATVEPDGPDPAEPEIGDLFERLRTDNDAEQSPPAEPVSTPERTEVPEAKPAPSRPDPDPLDLRERLLLPIINGGVREVRLRVVEMQNVGLDAVRIQRGAAVWEPEVSDVEREMVESLGATLEAAASAGVAAAAEMAGGGAVSAPEPLRGVSLLRAMAESLAADLTRAAGLGTDRRATVAEVGRVFRSWRNDHVDRWVRTIAYAGYHEGLLAGLAAAGIEEVVGVRHGRLCPECPAGTGVPWFPGGDPSPGTVVPPAGVDCTCAIAIHP